MTSTIESDALRGTVMTLRREVTDLRNRCDELFHALAVALSVPLNDDGEALHEREQHLLDWARSFMDQRTAHNVARMASEKYAASKKETCQHDWAYDQHRAGMLCGTCGAFVSDMT